MTKSGLFYIICTLVLCSCLGLESENISDDIPFQPDVSLPLGQLLVEYNDIDDLPIVPPIDLSPVTYHERDTVYFRIEENVAVRDRIMELMFQFDSKNRFPAQIEVHLYYWNEMDVDIYLTQDPIILPAAEMDAAGNIIKERIELTQMPLSDEQIDDIVKINRFVVEAKVVDAIFTNEVVQKINTYSISTAVGVRAHVNLQ